MPGHTRFIQPDDYIILMVDQDGGQYTVDDLKAVRDTGVKTVMRTVVWRDIEQRPVHFNWGLVHSQITADRKAGLKTLLQVYDLAPAFFPEEWYMHGLDGKRLNVSFYANMLAPWVEEAFEAHRDFIAMACTQFNACDVLCFRGICHGGECFFPDAAPVELPEGTNLEVEAERAMLYEQHLFTLTHPSGEYFTTLHHAFDPLPYTANASSPRIIEKLHARFGADRHYGICFTRFEPVGGVEEHDRDAQRFPLFCGSEYCEGLLSNTDRAIGLGYRGFVTAPLHAMSPHRQLAPWMLEALKSSVRKWESARAICPA